MSDAFELDDPTVAAGNPFSGKNSSIERSLRARRQPRDKRGRWVPTGAALMADLRLPDGTSTKLEGKAIGGTATREGEKNNIRMLVGKGYEQFGIEENTVVEIDPKNGELKSKVKLDRDYLLSKGINPDLTADLPEDLADQPQTLEEMNPQPADELDIELANTGLTDEEDKDRRAERDAEPVAKLSPAVAEKAAEGSEVREIVESAEKGELPKDAFPGEGDQRVSDQFVKKLSDRLQNIDRTPFDLTSESATTPEESAISKAIDDVFDGADPAEVISKLENKKILEPTKTKTAEQLVEGDVIQFPSGVQAIVRQVKPVEGSQGTKLSFVLENENGDKKTLTGSTSDKVNIVEKPDRAKFKKKPTPPRPKPSEEVAKKAPEKPKAPEPSAAPEESAGEVVPPKPAKKEKPKVFTPPSPRNKDDGKDFARPDGFTDQNIKDAESARKVPVARDADGNVVEIYDEKGKKKAAQDADAVLATLLDVMPDAKVNDKGEVVLERGKFADPDGTEYGYAVKIARTNGGGFLVGVDVTNPDGSTETFWHRSERQSMGAMKPFALVDYITGKGWPAEGGKPGTPDYKTYFEPGTLEARMKYLRNTKMRKINEQKLLADLDAANALPETDAAKDIEVMKAEYLLNKFRTEFGGNVDEFSNWYRAQSGKTLLLTTEELVDKMATGFHVNYNYAEGSQFGNVLRSSRTGLYEDLVAGNYDGVAQHLLALGNKLPTWARNSETAQNILDKIRASYKSRFPEMNSKRLSAILTNAFKSMWDFSDESAAEKPHVSFDGKVLRPGTIVEFLNNNDEPSIGRVRSLSPQESGNTDNIYFDYVFVEYLTKDGNITTEAVETVSKSLVVVDDSGMTREEAKKVMTTYKPWIRGSEKIAARFGRAVDQKGNKLSKRYMSLPDLDSPEAVTELAPEPETYDVDTAGVGDMHVSKDGTPIGVIVTKKAGKNSKGEDVWAIVYRKENGELEKTTVKKGTVRNLKK